MPLPIDVITGTSSTKLSVANWNTYIRDSINNLRDHYAQNCVYDVTHPDYGAHGDGITDDRDHINTAQTAAGVGKAIYFPPGTYLVSSNITISSDVIFAYGAKLSIDNTKVVTFTGNVLCGISQIISGLGTVSFTGNTKIKEYYPQWWGATADGATDDNTAIQAMVAAVPSGSSIYFPIGTYIVSAQVSINKKLTLTGQGTIKLKANSSVIGGNWYWFYVSGDDVKFTGLTFDGNGTNQTNLYNMLGLGSLSVTNGNRIEVSGCTIINAYGTAICCGKSNEVIIQGCFIYDVTGGGGNPGEGISFSSTSKANVINCIFGTVADHHVYVDAGASNINITGCNFKGATVSQSIVIYGSANNVVVTGCTFDDNNVGVLVTDKSNVMPQNITISGNAIKSGHGVSATYGIQVSASATSARQSVVTISGNTIYQLGLTDDIIGHGIVIQRASGITITGNAVSNNNSAGILLQGADSINVIGNSVFDNCKKAGGAYPAGVYVETLTYVPTNIVISENMIYDSLGTTQTYGVRVDNGNIKVTDNLMYGNVSLPVYIANGANAGEITTVTDTYTILSTDSTIICNKATPFTVTLPVAVVGQQFTIKNIGVGRVTIEGNGAETIEGDANIYIDQLDNRTVQCYTTGLWAIIGYC